MNHKLPSGAEVEITELTGADLRQITNQKNLKSKANDVMSEIIKRRTTLVNGEAPEDEFFDKLLSADAARIMFGIRLETYGHEFLFNLECTKCGAVSELEADLNDFEFHPYPTPDKLSYTFKIKDKEYRFKLLNMELEKKYGKFIKSPDALTPLILREVREIRPGKKDKDKPTQFAVNWDSIGAGTINEIKKEIKKHEAEYDTVLDCSCDNCGKVHHVNVMAENTFFFPDGI